MLALGLFVIPPLIACVLSRISMYHAVTHTLLDWRAFLAVIIPGASADMLFVLCPGAAVFLLLSLFPASTVAYVSGVIFMTLICLAVVLFNIADAVIYAQSHKRFFYSLLAELRPRVIMKAASASQRKILACLPFLMAVYAALPFLAPRPTAEAGFVCLGLSFCFFAAGGFLGRMEIDAFALTASSCSWNVMRVAERTAERIETIKLSAFRNFIGCLRDGWLERHSRIVPMEYTPNEQDILRKISLLQTRTYAEKKPDQRLYQCCPAKVR
ncbi:membrane hypothetical protein [uncultured delta proteobacterium]|uniref:Uncharacterized protein n=1 Tax=uncultured delta proteobacterium TaxID=34034 RepID=A0A212J8Q3_9DELT|nr:membrane hypothetical protein [uncultured delta proteobacterium]